MRGDAFSVNGLENIMNSRSMGVGRIINETLNPPTYLRRQKSRRSEQNPLMISYGYFPVSSNRELVVVHEHHGGNGTQ